MAAPSASSSNFAEFYTGGGKRGNSNVDVRNFLSESFLNRNATVPPQQHYYPPAYYDDHYHRSYSGSRSRSRGSRRRRYYSDSSSDSYYTPEKKRKRSRSRKLKDDRKYENSADVNDNTKEIVDLN